MACALATALPMLSLLTGCTPKSDDELIESRVREFVSAYNSGDLDGVIACMDTSSRTFLKGAAGLLGVVTETDTSEFLTDLFGVSATVVSDGEDLLTILSIDINFDSQEQADVRVSIRYRDYQQQVEDILQLDMVKEKGNWYIRVL